MRVLCTCLPGYGHFNPMVPLARALARAGHEVAFATSEEFRPRVERAGFPAFPVGMSLREQIETAERIYPEAQLPPGRERWMSFVPRMLAGVAAPARAGDLVPLVRRWSPDVVVSDETDFAGPVAAAASGVPWANHAMSVLRPLEMARLAARVLAPLCREWGVTLGPFGGLFRYLYLDVCPPSLQADHIDQVPVAHPIRNVDDLDTAEGDALPPWADSLPDLPTVYVTLGTVHKRSLDVLATIVEGLRDEAMNVIATVGEGTGPEVLGPQPENVHVEPYIPLSLLLPCLDVIVTQGGTSILPALGQGLPLLITPQGADQFYNADACIAAGVGRRLLPSEVTSAAVGREVRLLLEDPTIRDRARLVQREIHEMPLPHEGAVGLLERLAREGQPLVGPGRP